LKFDVKDPVHLDFIIAAANLRAQVFGLIESPHLQGNRDVAYFVKVLSQIHLPPWQPKAGVKIQVNENENANSNNSNNSNTDEEQEIEQIKAKLPVPGSLPQFKLNPIDFEKV
jgi:ubiquitin-activating enzyme E1